MKKPELLAPAGSFEKAKIAFMYGADAVYCGTSSLSLRTRADMDNNDLVRTIEYAEDVDIFETDELNETEHFETHVRTCSPRFELPLMPEGYVMDGDEPGHYCLKTLTEDFL